MNENEIVDKIFEYDNYRFFLRDFFSEQKRVKATFSHRAFAKKAGFSTSSFFSHVTEGKRNLTENSLKKMLKGLSLRGRRATFFKNLVQYNQADSVEEREKYYKKLNKIRRSSELYAVDQKQWEYYEEWYYPVIRELAVTSDWNGDFKKLGQMVRPVVTQEKVEKAVQLLLDINMLNKTTTGYALTHEGVTAADVPAVVTRKMRKEYIQLALNAMEELPLEERLIAGVTVTLTEEKYREVEQKLNELRQLILSEGLGETSGTGKVYQVNMQAYPLSEEFSFSTEKGGDVE